MPDESGIEGVRIQERGNVYQPHYNADPCKDATFTYSIKKHAHISGARGKYFGLR